MSYRTKQAKSQNLMPILFSLIFLFSSTGCPNPTPVETIQPLPDADISEDADEILKPDADNDADPITYPQLDGAPPHCDAGQLKPIEISPSPAYAHTPYIATHPDGFGAIWLQNKNSPFDIVFAPFSDLSAGPSSDPITVATDRPHASSPVLEWINEEWLIIWSEAENESACTYENQCQRKLMTLRISNSGEVLSSILPLWSEQYVTTRLALVSDANKVFLTFVGPYENSKRTFFGQLDHTGAEQGKTLPIFENQPSQDIPPTIMKGTNNLVIFATTVLGGLYGVIISPIDGSIVGEPISIDSNITTSSHSAAFVDPYIGLLYLRVDDIRASANLIFVVFNENVEQQTAHMIINDPQFQTFTPQITAMPPGWIVSWVDGRFDNTTDCRTFGFCNKDILFLPLSVSGPHIPETRVSLDDPNDCTNPVFTGTNGVARFLWSTYREKRSTIITTYFNCDAP